MCEYFGVSASEIISSGKLGYPRTNIPIPIHRDSCLEKDPHILNQSVLENGGRLKIIPTARSNENQPKNTKKQGTKEALKIKQTFHC